MTEVQATSGDWVQAQAKRRAQQALLPVPLKALVRRIRSHSLALDILNDILKHVHSIASTRGWLIDRQSPTGGRVHLLRAREYAILEELSHDRGYLGDLRSQIDWALRGSHGDRIDPAQAQEARPFHGAGYQVTGAQLVVDSDTGLGSASMQEGEPEGWDRWLLDDYLQRRDLVPKDDDISMDSPVSVSALVLGANAGGVARAAMARVYPGVVFTIDEQDRVLSDKTAGEVVRSRRTVLDEQPSDLVALIMPSPAAPAAAQHRATRYQPEGTNVDPASVGPGRWFPLLCEQLEVVSRSLHSDSLGYLIVPLGTRTWNGYENDEGRLAQILAVLAELGLRVLQQHQLVERQPVPRPFVGRHRPERVSLVVQREGV